MVSTPLLLINGFSFLLPVFFVTVFEDCKPVQEEIAKATGNEHPVSSDPEPGDLCASEEEKNAANTEHDASGGKIGCQSGTRLKLLTEVFQWKCLPFPFPVAIKVSLCFFLS